MGTTVAPPLARAPTVDRRLQLMQTAAYYLAFVALGLIGPLVGPSLNSLAANTGSALSAVSAVFVANSLGRLAGSLLGGRLLDRVPGHPLVAAGLAGAAALMAAIPLAPALTVLVTAFFVLGIAQNFIDVSGNTLLVWTHGGARVGPYMNGLHLMFGVGAFFAPVVAARALGWGGDIRWAYWFAAVLMAPIALWLLRLPSPMRRPTATRAAVDAPVSKSLIASVCLFFFLVVGAEVAMAGWTFNFGTAIGLDSDGAAALAAAFWGAYTFGRLIAIPISTRASAPRVMVADLAACIAGAAIFTLGPAWPAAAWVGAFVIGLGMASIFPTMLTFVGGRLNVTGKINGVLFAGSNLGAMTFPWLIGQGFEPLGPGTLSVVVLAAMTAAAVVFAIINVATRRSERRDPPGSQPT